MNRSDILDKAKACVCGDREQDYGKPENSFGVIASLWTTYLGNALVNPDHEPGRITAKDVAVMLSLLKIARIATGHAKSDNWIDLAGYAACGGEIETGAE